jgi:hypothetical protein
MFRRNTLPSSSRFNKPSKKPELCLPIAFKLVSCSAYSTLKMEVNVSPKRQFTFNGLRGIITQKMKLIMLLFEP